MRKGRMLMLLGLALIAFAFLQPVILATLEISPYSTIPKNGDIYNELTKVAMITPYYTNLFVRELGWILDSNPLVYLNLVETNPQGMYHRWELAITNPSTGQHSFIFRLFWYQSDEEVPQPMAIVFVTTEDYAGTFTIAEPSVTFTGKWYINDIEITSSDQTVSVTGNTVAFKFVKTSTTSDSLITISVAWSGPEIYSRSVPRKSAGVWEIVHTFSKVGTYTVTLTATAGAESIVLSLVGAISISSTPDVPSDEAVTTPQDTGTKKRELKIPFMALMFAGVALVGYGWIQERKKQ